MYGDEGCYACVFWSQDSDLENFMTNTPLRGYPYSGRCRRYPPDGAGRLPETRDRHWCGEYLNTGTHEPSAVMRPTCLKA